MREPSKDPLIANFEVNTIYITVAGKSDLCITSSMSHQRRWRFVRRIQHKQSDPFGCLENEIGWTFRMNEKLKSFLFHGGLFTFISCQILFHDAFFNVTFYFIASCFMPQCHFSWQRCGQQSPPPHVSANHIRPTQLAPGTKVRSHLILAHVWCTPWVLVLILNVVLSSSEVAVCGI